MLSGALAAVVLIGGTVAVLELAVFGTSSPPPLTLGGAAGSATRQATSSSAAGSSTSTVTAGGSALSGTWSVGGGSVAGYRVREQLGFLPSPSDAVGRTSSIKGSVTLAGSGGALTVSAASFTVDVSTLTSDRQMRDQRIHEMGLQSDTYPNATFTLTEPITLPANAASVATLNVQATGTLTIHGTAQTVTIPLTARVSSNAIEVAGSTTFPFERFGMTPPSIGGFVSVQDSATMEFDIHLKQA